MSDTGTEAQAQNEAQAKKEAPAQSAAQAVMDPKRKRIEMLLVMVMGAYNLAVAIIAVLWIFTNCFGKWKGNLGMIETFQVNEYVTYGLFFSGALGGAFYCLRSMYQKVADTFDPKGNVPAERPLNMRAWSFWYFYRPLQGGILALILLVLTKSSLLQLGPLPTANAPAPAAPVQTEAPAPSPGDSLPEDTTQTDSGATTTPPGDSPAQGDVASSSDDKVQSPPLDFTSFYTLIGLGFLAGFGSHEVIQKIEDVIKVLFSKSSTKDEKRNPPTGGGGSGANAGSGQAA